MTTRDVRRRQLALFTVALRVVALVVGLQFSGAVHAVGEVVAVVLGQAAHEDACPLDGGACHDCPPGCPNCHCPNAPVATPPGALVAALMSLDGARIRAGSRRSELPPSPELPLPFRPPRTLAVAA